ncbi:MAG: urease accessory protein UreE [Rhizobiaceae bacterium]|nr:urease accessory protein UreE [Rhizobiaceae bacterium]
MKLSLNTDFTRLPRAGSIIRATEAKGVEPFDVAVLEHDERHLRRRVLTLRNGGQVLVDLLEPVALHDGDLLALDDGRHVGIVAPSEAIYEVRARNAVHLAQLAWHIGNRHLPAAIEAERIVILRDHVIRDMLEGLGAAVTEAVEPFNPLRGAYSGHGGHGHHHHGHHDHGHSHGEPDAYGRLPGDPHYGHNHA